LDVCLSLETNPEIYFPLERKLGEKPEINTFSVNAQGASLNMEDIGELSKLFNVDLIDKQTLLANIQELLLERSQVSLKEVVEIKGITKGLSELLAYVTLINVSSKFFMSETVREVICFDYQLHKYLELPQIIFSN